MKQIECQRCGKMIDKRGGRKYCLQCRKAVDDELAKQYIEKHSKQKRGN